MRITRTVKGWLLGSALALSFGAGASRCWGQAPCAPSSGPPNFASIAVYPPAPRADQSFLIAVERVNLAPTQPTSILVAGNSINVTVTGMSLGFDPPVPSCTVVQAGPLPAGVYLINFYGRVVSSGGVGPPILITSAPLQVAAAPAAIPAVSAPVLLTAALLLAASAALQLLPNRAFNRTPNGGAPLSPRLSGPVNFVR
jgi:hypothetical protein